jgi:predicted membrane chloride channel (bestrophin family)
MNSASKVREHVADKKIPTKYEDIMKKDKQRTLLLSKGSESMYYILMHWTATLLPELAKRKLTYVPMVSFLGMWVILKEGPQTLRNTWLDIDSTDAERALRGVGILVAVLLVSLMSKTFDRFFQQYFEMVKCRTAAISFMGMARAYIDDDELVKLLLRYSNLANVTSFVGLTPTYTKENFFDPITTQFELITDSELDTVEGLVGPNTEAAVAEVFVWLYSALKVAEEQGIISTFEKKDLQDSLLEQQDSLITLWNWVYQPLPFPYVNLVITMDMGYLVLYSGLQAFTAVEGNILTLPIIAIAIITIATLGLIRLSLMMNDPFSNDDWALRVGQLCTTTINDSKAMLGSRHREVIEELDETERIMNKVAVEPQELMMRKKISQHLTGTDSKSVSLNPISTKSKRNSGEEETKSNPMHEAEGWEQKESWDSI